MKLKKIIWSSLALVTLSTTIATSMTSCAGVSSDIIDNMVSTGDKTKLSSNVTLDQAIKTALTNKTATDAFKKSVVNAILESWWNQLVDEDSSDTVDQNKKFDKAVDDDYDDKVQSYKDSHGANWPYYFQNEVLNPVGGTQALWKQNEKQSKIREYFMEKIFNLSYLGVPDFSNFSDSKTAAASYDPNNLYYKLNRNPNVASNHLGTGSLSSGDTQPLNPDWWPTINFYASANPNFVKGNKNYLDDTYALIQRETFNEYTTINRPISTGMVLWKYSLPYNQSDLTKVYNADKIPNADSSSSSEDSVGAKPLDEPSYTFPYFGNAKSATSLSPNEEFANFANNAITSNYYMNDRDDAKNDDAGKLGLVNIPGKYTDDSSDMFLITQQGLTNSYETYGAVMADLFHQSELNGGKTAALSTMPQNDALYGTTGDTPDIMQNFLFRADLPGIHDVSVKHIPESYKDYAFDLQTVYQNSVTTDGGVDYDHIELFNHDTDWYKYGARYVVNAIQLAKENEDESQGDPLPYVMIRNTSGVHIEAIDGADYLSQTNQSPTPSDSTWRPGDPWSQERENQILKYRTLYENTCVNKDQTPASGTGIQLIKYDSTNKAESSSVLPTYFSSNQDTIILETARTILDSKPSSTTADDNNYYNNNLLGLKGTCEGNDTKTIFTENLSNLIRSFDQLNQYQQVVTDYSTINKKLFAWSNTYRTNHSSSPYTSEGSDPLVDTVYSNGLATDLPLDLYSGNFNVDGSTTTFQYDAQTYYDVALNCIEDLATPIDKNIGTAKTGYVDDWSNVTTSWLINMTTPLNGSSSYIDNVIQAYKTWQTGDNIEVLKNGAGKGKDDVDYHYSEDLLTYNQYVNDMLWSFCSGSTATNSEKTAALNTYLGNYNFDEYKDAITSLYISKKLISSDTSLTSYFNDLNPTNDSNPFENYKTGLWNEWNYSLNTNLGSTTINDGSSVISNGNSDKLIDYQTLKASIKYLMGEKSSTDYGKNFLDKYLSNKISNYSVGYLAWIAKDNAKFNDYNLGFDETGGNLTDAEVEKIYGWKNNYDGLFDNVYQNSNLSSSDEQTFTSFDQYWQYAPMPISSSSDPINAMGFLGLVTSNDSGSLPSNVKDALFSKFGSASDNTSTDTTYRQVGTLYGYHDRQTLVNRVLGVSVGSVYKDIASDIDKQTNLFSDTISRLDNVTSATLPKSDSKPNYWTISKAQQAILLNAVDPTTYYVDTDGTVHSGDLDWPADTKFDNCPLAYSTTNPSPLKDQFFNGYNLEGGSNTPTLELTNPGINGDGYNTPWIRDSNDKNMTGTRTRVMQINHYDISYGPDDTTNVATNSQGVISHLNDILGNNLLTYIVVQAAMDSSIQSNAISTVISSAYNDSKAEVWDRRFNDTLGSTWVKDWKSKN